MEPLLRLTQYDQLVTTTKLIPVHDIKEKSSVIQYITQLLKVKSAVSIL